MRIKLYFLLVTIMLIAIEGCNTGTSGVYQNENIQSDVKNEIKTLDQEILKAITTNNITLMESLMSEKLLEKVGSDIGSFVKQGNDIIKSNEYDILDQYYVINSTTNIGNVVVSGVENLDDYIIHYQALNEKMFISLIIPKGEQDKILITNIYGKYSNGWKLNVIQIGQYTIYGNTATELYKKAKSEYSKGYLIDAGNSMFLSSKVSNPAQKIWEYQKEDEMKALYNIIRSELKIIYEFPLSLTYINSKPQIINIYPEGMRDGIFPMVEYLTKIDLRDTLKTKLENDKIHSIIGTLFKGIDKEKKFIFYKAYNEIPKGGDPVPTYGFVKENNLNGG